MTIKQKYYDDICTVIARFERESGAGIWEAINDMYSLLVDMQADMKPNEDTELFRRVTKQLRNNAHRSIDSISDSLRKDLKDGGITFQQYYAAVEPLVEELMTP